MFSNTLEEVPVLNYVKEQWKNIKYENLSNLTEIVKLDQDDAFFIISHPEKTNRFAHHYGWKLHISVHPDDLQKAFDLAAPVISQYCFHFKITNPEKITNKNSRFFVGAQITIYLEENEKPVILAEQAQEMIEKINKIFLDKDNNIKVGKKPDSDAKTISDYFSIRNDKQITTQLAETPWAYYFNGEAAGKNINPYNNSNPFDTLLISEQKSFDVLQHFLAFEFDTNIENKDAALYATLYAYLHEYTLIESMDIKSRINFIIQSLEYGDSIDEKFLKTPYRNDPEVILGIQHAASILTVLSEFSKYRNVNGNLNFHDDKKCISYFNTAKLSARYPYDNSFKQLLTIIENHFKNDNVKPYFAHVLVEQWKKAAQEKIDNLANQGRKEDLTEIVRKEHFYDSQAALEYLQSNCTDDEFIKILEENDIIPAAQLKLAEIYRFKNTEKSEEYLLKAIISEAINCIELKSEFCDILMKTKNLEELLALDKSGNLLATATLVTIYIRDANPSNKDVIERFSEAPIDYKLAKEYLIKLESHTLFVDFAAELNKGLNKALNKFEYSDSQTQTSFKF